MADWYVQHLGFSVRRAADSPVVVRFLADSSGSVMLEIYRNRKVPVPDFRAMPPMLLHLAFVCHDVRGTADRLVQAGATLDSGPEILGEDEFAVLRDPWGLAIQLVRRGNPML